jgi:hypothetical protein
MRLQRDDFIHVGTMRPYSDNFFRLRPLLYCGHVRMTEDSHCFSEEEDDTPQVLYQRVDRRRLKLSDTYWSSYAATTLCTRKVNDNPLSILMHQTVAMLRDLSLSRP